MENIDNSKELSENSKELSENSKELSNNSKELSDNSKILSDSSKILSNNSKELSKSPFSIYEEKFCNRCDQYNGCIGLVSSTSTAIGIEDTNIELNQRADKYQGQINTKNTNNSKMLFGDKMFLDMVKGMGVSLYTHKFKMILECMEARKLMKDNKNISYRNRLLQRNM